MKINFRYLLVAIALTLNGCACKTPIKDLPLPPVSTIEGTITHISENGFTLKDDSGSILVRAELPGDAKLIVANGEKVTVYGNLLGGQTKVFDGYVIKKASGEQIIISNPTPHFGFVIQSSFQ